MADRDTTRAEKAYRRRDQIRLGFYELLKTTPYDDITISDLCDHIGIARKIFYKHYRDKRDCMCVLIDSILSETQAITATLVADWKMSWENAVVIMECWKSKHEFLDIIVKNNFIDLMMERAIKIGMSEDITTQALLNRSDMPCDEDILSIYLSCHFTLIFQWYSRGFDTPVEEMARKYLRMAILPMISITENAAGGA